MCCDECDKRIGDFFRRLSIENILVFLQNVIGVKSESFVS